MLDFNKKDFLNDKEELNKKYDILDSGTEGIIYKVNDDVVAKKFYYPRPLLVKQVQDIIEKSNPQKILTPFDFLIDKPFIYCAFLNYFHGKSVETDVSVINFSVLIEFTKQILQDIRKISDNNVLLKDITKSSIMYSDTDMVLVDTTKSEFSVSSNSNLAMQDNLITLFHDSCAFSILDSEHGTLLRNIINSNPILRDLMRDFENYNYFFEELRKSMEEIAGTNVKSIENGIAKIKKNQ